MAEEDMNESTESPAARGKRLAKEAREAEMRKSIEAEMREKIEAEYAAKSMSVAEKVQASLVEPVVSEQGAVELPKPAVAAEQQEIAALLDEFGNVAPVQQPWVDHPDVQRDPHTSDLPTEGSVTVHFITTGLTALGHTWNRGEEITVSPGSHKWQQLTDASIGRMILSLDEVEQIRRWGKRFFAPGPWPYTVDDAVDAPRKEKVLRG